MAWLLKAHPLIEKDIKKLSKTDKEPQRADFKNKRKSQ